MSKMYKKKQTFNIVGKIDYHQQLKEASQDQNQINLDNRKVLIIHTGGTIGMFKDANGKFQPKKDEFKNFLNSYPYFSDESQTYFLGCEGFTITPQTIYKKKIWYKFKQLQKLIDSTNMNIERINIILDNIEKQYDNYDAFIVLHGTDTMSFTASSLSFMIQNLKKPIILTGSQVPMGQTRNDALNNLLCALTIAGHYLIPEVLLIFDNAIMRGNRTTKTSASSFNSFKSPNYYNIGTLGLKIQIKWQLIRMCKIDKPTKFTKLSSQVGLLKLTPFGLPVNPNTKYLVIQSYGVGNVPTEGPFFDWLKANSQKQPQNRIIIVNISQVYQSVILNLYATGDMAYKLGLIPGSDMTCQAAVSKLSYLASQKLSYDQIKQQITKNLRGQLTQSQDRQAIKNQGYILNCTTMLQKNFITQSERFKQIMHYNILPQLVSERASHSGVNRLIQSGIKIDKEIGCGRTLLHQYFLDKQLHGQNTTYINFLLSSGLDINKKDDNQSTALFYALENNHIKEAMLLRQRQGVVSTNWKRVFRGVRNNQMQLLLLMIQFNDNLKYKNSQGRNILSYCVYCDNKEMFSMLIQNLNWQEQQQTFYLDQEDVYGMTARKYAEQHGWGQLIN